MEGTDEVKVTNEKEMTDDGVEVEKPLLTRTQVKYKLAELRAFLVALSSVNQLTVPAQYLDALEQYCDGNYPEKVAKDDVKQ